MELSTVIVPESKTWHALLTMIGSIKVLELTENLVGSLITFERLNIAKQSRISQGRLGLPCDFDADLW